MRKPAIVLVPLLVLSLMPAPGTAQGLVTLMAGYRAGRADHNVPAGPMLGIVLTPIRGRWVALGFDLSWAPRITASDSGAIQPPCFDPQGNPTTCGSRRDEYGESTLQIGAALTVRRRDRRTAPFAELALGYYGIESNARVDYWDPTGLHLSNMSTGQTRQQGGLYSRVGLGVQMKPWSKGPGLTVSARYRWASVGWPEEKNPRDGAELVLGVRL